MSESIKGGFNEAGDLKELRRLLKQQAEELRAAEQMEKKLWAYIEELRKWGNETRNAAMRMKHSLDLADATVIESDGFMVDLRSNIDDLESRLKSAEAENRKLRVALDNAQREAVQAKKQANWNWDNRPHK